MKLAQAEAARLAKFYADAEAELLRVVYRALAKGNKTQYLRAMLENVQAILGDLRAGSRDWCMQAVPRMYVNGISIADDMTGKAATGFGAIHQQAAQVLAENTYNRLADVTQVVGRRASDIYRTLALENVRGSVVGYSTWQQVARGLRQDLADRGITGFVDRSGNEWNLRRYAEMVARTTTRECQVEGTKNRLLELGHDLVVITSHHNPCDLCAPWEGQVVSLTGQTPGYPTMEEAKAAGLFHPNCRHFFGLHVDVEGETEALERELSESTSLRENRQGSSSEATKQPAPLSLASIPESVGIVQAARKGIEQAVGRVLINGLKTGTEWLEVANADSGQALYNQVKGTANEVVFPEALVRLLAEAKRQSVVLVHNHIDSTAFSDGDIARLVQFDSLKGILAIGHDGTQYYVGKTAKTPAVRESKIRADYQKYLLRHLGWLNKQVADGKMTKDAALKEYSHRVAESLAKVHKLEYVRWGEP